MQDGRGQTAIIGFSLSRKRYAKQAKAEVVSCRDMKQMKRELWEFLIWGIHCGEISVERYTV